MRARAARVVALVMLIAAMFPMAANARASHTLTIFAASSLSDALTEIAAAFRKANPGVEIVFNFGSSSTLATQLANGAPADIFASANDKQMDVARQTKRIAGEPQTFARNRLILIVPADNPAKIGSLRDLAKAGIKLVVAAPNVPVREYTNTMLERLVNVPEYGTAYKTAFLNNVVSEEDNVRQVSAKVALGEADAGIVYQSDVTPDVARKVLTLTIPDAYNTVATYPIALTDNSANPTLAQAFIDYVLSYEGQAVMEKWGFVPVRRSIII